MILGIIIFLISFMILLGIIFLIIRYVKPLKETGGSGRRYEPDCQGEHLLQGGQLRAGPPDV